MIRAFCDGSGTTANQPAFVGVAVFRGPLLIAEGSSHVGNGSNIFAELKAIQLAIVVAKNHLVRVSDPLTIHTDSLWSIKAISGEHRVGPDHILLVEAIRDLLFVASGIRLEHVRGHAGIPGNDLADWLATKARCQHFGKVSRRKRPKMPEREELLLQPRYHPLRKPKLEVIECQEPERWKQRSTEEK